jgi:hypothetical protein
VALRRAGGQLPGDGGHRLSDDVAAFVNRQTASNLERSGVKVESKASDSMVGGFASLKVYMVLQVI